MEGFEIRISNSKKVPMWLEILLSYDKSAIPIEKRMQCGTLLVLTKYLLHYNSRARDCLRLSSSMEAMLF